MDISPKDHLSKIGVCTKTRITLCFATSIPIFDSDYKETLSTLLDVDAYLSPTIDTARTTHRNALQASFSVTHLTSQRRKNQKPETTKNHYHYKGKGTLKLE